MNIRLANENDISIIEKIVTSCKDNAFKKHGLQIWKGYTPEKILEKYNTGNILLLVDDEKTVGISWLSFDPPMYFFKNKSGVNEECINFLELYTKTNKPIYLSMFGVDAEYQDKGVGTKFLEMLYAWSKVNGSDSMRIDVNEVVPGLIDFYLKRGFKKLPFYIQNAGIKSWLMERL
jgi:GNAT superfamily N-acetyltransferase